MCTNQYLEINAPHYVNIKICEIFKFTISNTNMHKKCPHFDIKHMTYNVFKKNPSTVYTNIVTKNMKPSPHTSV